MTKVTLWILLIVVKMCASIEIYSPEVDKIPPHNYYSHANNKILDSPILRSLYYNQ